MHNKSVKHISLNGKRERIDQVISNLFVSKISKHRQFTIALSRKRPASGEIKVKDTMPKKISVEKWSKRGNKKQSKGPRYFQSNLRKNKSKHLEEWEKLNVIPWGGYHQQPCGNTLELTNTCTIDNFFQMLYIFYVSNIHEMRKLFESNHDIIKKNR